MCDVCRCGLRLSRSVIRRLLQAVSERLGIVIVVVDVVTDRLGAFEDSVNLASSAAGRREDRTVSRRSKRRGVPTGLGRGGTDDSVYPDRRRGNWRQLHKGRTEPKLRRWKSPPSRAELVVDWAR